MVENEQGLFSNTNLVPFEPYELDLLKNILWLVNNLSCKSPIAHDFASNGFAKHVYLLTLAYHTQFDFNLWRVLVWNMRMMSSVLDLLESPKDQNCINLFWLTKFKDVICGFL